MEDKYYVKITHKDDESCIHYLVWKTDWFSNKITFSLTHRRIEATEACREEAEYMLEGAKESKPNADQCIFTLVKVRNKTC